MSLVSLYDEASLWMTPGAYEDGKLLSELPTDGSGDFTFIRGSNLAATRVDANGLIEKGRENLLLQSNQFDTNWESNTTNREAVVSSGELGYDGSNDAWLVLDTTGSGRHQIASAEVVVSGINTASVYAKAYSNSRYLVLAGFGMAAIDESPIFDLDNGTIDMPSNSTVIKDATITSVGNGWYRCSIMFLYSGTSSFFIALANSSTDNSLSAYTYTGTGSNGFYIQDAQLEQGLVATDYIETGASTAQAGVLESEPRLDYSGSASCPSLLLEPQRTNSFPQSEYPNTSTLIIVNGGYTWTYNQINSPEGVRNAAKWSAANNNAVVGIYRNFSATSGASYTFSVFAKKGDHNFIQLQNGGGGSGSNSYANFDLENGTKSDGATITDAFIDDFGNGWYRCGITFSVSSTTTSNCSIDIIDSLSADRNSTFTGSVGNYFYLWGMQVEQGSYPTSYIPTYGTIQTRLIDTNADLSSPAIAGATEWTFVFDNTDSIVNQTGQLILRINSTTNKYSAIFTSGAISFYNNISGFFGTAGIGKICIKYDGTHFHGFSNGVKASSKEAIGFGTTSYLSVFSGTGIGGPLHQMLFFKTALSDSECIALTKLD